MADVKSVTRSKAGVLSRFADFLQFRLNPKKLTFVAEQRQLGAPSASQTSRGIFWPTVQGAIDDLAGRSEVPVGGVLINTSGNEPRSISQSDRIAVSGTVLGTGPVMIYVFGYPITVEGGDTDIAVAGKIAAAFVELMVNGAPFSTVEVDPTDSTILNITYNDYQDHVFEPLVQKGITLTQTTVVEPQPGYGEWEWLGSIDQTLSGGSSTGPVTFFYYKRTS